MGIGKKFIGIDLGAESGRILLAGISGEKIEIEEISRFQNFPHDVFGHLYWDIFQIWSNIKTGIRKASAQTEQKIAGIGIDSWALDFGLVDKNGELLGNPHCYRDSRTDNILEKIKPLISESDLFQHTGLSYLTITTLSQLLEMKASQNPAYANSKSLLMLPSLLIYWLTGVKSTEITIAGNTQLLNVNSRNWDNDLITRFGLRSDLLTDLIPSGTVIGDTLPKIEEELGCSRIQVIATACHDTASAAAAAPITGNECAIISCGTWSVIGKELPFPLLSNLAMRKGYHNIQGACNTYYFANYSIGLWLLQELRRELEFGSIPMDYAILTELASKAKPFCAVINPDEKMFFRPGRISENIIDFCNRTGQSKPQNTGEFARVILEGLALRYRNSIRDLEMVTGEEIKTINLIGGGSRNQPLCQFTADATQKIVVAGPGEATGTANILLQAMALGQISGLKELRQIVRNSFELRTYIPGNNEPWEEADGIFSRFSHLKI